MSGTEPLDVIEKLAARIMEVDPSDESDLIELVASLADLGAALDGAPEHRLLNDVLAPLSTILAGESNAPAADFEKACEAVSALQDALSAPQSDAAQAAGNGLADEHRKEDGIYVMPEWVDEATLQEFSDAQRHGLEEIEADIMNLEKDTDRARSSLRRRLHTLKGEAGVLGLDALEQVCHTVEELLDTPESVAQQVDHLLLIKDWMVNALSDYADSKLPRVAGVEMIETIRQWMATAAIGAPTGAVEGGPFATRTATVANTESEAPVREGEDCTSDSMAATADDESAPPTISEKADRADSDALGATPAVPLERDQDTVELLSEFLQEAGESLSEVDEILLQAEAEGAGQEQVDALFRVFHTLKGVAGFLGLDDITALAHTTETMLDRVRAGALAMQGSVIDQVFDATRLMRTIVERVRVAVENQYAFAPNPELADIIDRLRRLTCGESVATAPEPAVAPNAPLGVVLSSVAEVPPEAVEAALRRQSETGLKLGEQLIADGTAEPKQVDVALRAQREAKTKAKIRETVKVDLARVDSMVTLIGELAIVESMVVNDPQIANDASPALRKHLVQLSGIARDLQNEGLRMRMVPVRGVFQKMARMVRDLSRKSGKQIRLVLAGEGSEMDRSMVERIADPLVHMIRNAVDHGIESPDGRRAAGKAEQGTMNLSAYHEGGNIVIEISDDGRGLDRNAILRKAHERQLIADGDQLSDGEVYDLIFAPGFSTAEKVTEISGRGVGMDVVKRNIEAMRGRVLTRSELGHGSTFKIVLPLTLAIIDGTVIACGSERYIIPTLSIVESVKPTADVLFRVADRGEVLSLRGETLPLLHLDQLFGIADAQSVTTESLVIIVESRERHIGLLIDDVVGRQQVVIKSLGVEFADVGAVSGAAILADGSVGLILDVDELARLMSSVRRREPTGGESPGSGQAAAA